VRRNPLTAPNGSQEHTILLIDGSSFRVDEGETVKKLATAGTAHRQGDIVVIDYARPGGNRPARIIVPWHAVVRWDQRYRKGKKPTLRDGTSR
jgi:hypothetical protein